MSRVPRGHALVVGLGISGNAIARHLARLGTPFMMADTRTEPPGLAEFRRVHPGVDVHCGSLTALDLEQATEIVLSPGVDPRTPGLEAAWRRTQEALEQKGSKKKGLKKKGLKKKGQGGPHVVGEMALFRRHCRAPIAAITGSNAKSTVTTLLGEMARDAGVAAAVGGNLGTPALDLLHECPEAALFILELSSFQLETTPELGATTAAFLNLCEDHLDRHGDMAAYRAAKQRIFCGAAHGVVNAEDEQTWPDDPALPVEAFSTRAPAAGQWGIALHDDGRGPAPWLMHGETPLMAVADVRLPGRHNHANALAALCMGTRLGFPLAAMRGTLQRFAGLAHRGELVAEQGGVRWINDSKGTNVGATLAAIAGIGAALEGRLIWLGGGLGKGADFTPLREPLRRYAREAILFGRDAPQLAESLGTDVPSMRVATLAEALERAAHIAHAGDCVLLSPACASLDQFTDYRARGDAFRHWVKDYLALPVAGEES